MTTQALLESQTILELEDRVFGVEEDLLKKLSQPIPPVFEKIAESLSQGSALLKLSDPTRGNILESYGHDLGFLRRRVNDFQFLIQNAVLCSLEVTGSGHSADAQVWEKIWSEVKPIGEYSIVLDLTAERSRLAEAELLAALQDDFRVSVSQIVHSFALWCQLLAETETIGLIEWGEHACRYHYFRNRITAETTREVKTERVIKDGWFVHIKDEKITTSTEMFRERHVHDIFDPKTHRLAEFPSPRKMPVRIREFCRQIPKWLVPFLYVVEGTSTHEEVIISNKVTDVQTTEKRRVKRYDPAIVLGEDGSFALAGWNEDDIRRERWRPLKNLAAFAGAGLVLAGIGWVIYSRVTAPPPPPPPAVSAKVVAPQVRRAMAKPDIPKYEMRYLEINAVTASSTHKITGKDTAAYRSVDNNVTTQWQSVRCPRGQMLTFETTSPHPITSVKVVNGYRPHLTTYIGNNSGSTYQVDDPQAERAAWKLNSRIKKATLYSGQTSQQISLKDTNNAQTVKVNLPASSVIKLVVDEVYRGTDGPDADVVLPEISFRYSVRVR